MPDSTSGNEHGEVFISDACIGCSNCERNCPYGVIQMAADKHPNPAAASCVRTCPTGAAIRISPEKFFNPDFPLGFVTMADAFFEAVSLRMRRQ